MKKDLIKDIKSKLDISVNEVYDGFEDEKLGAIWSHKRFEEYAIRIQSKIKRKGKQAVQVKIKPFDKFEDNKKYGWKNTERDEIREEWFLWAKEGDSYEYSFSMFLPKNFPVVPTRLVLAQWKQHDELELEDAVTNPIIALRYQDGIFRVTLQTTEEKINLFRTGKEIKGKWIDFKFQIRFTRKKSGFLRCWINKKQVIDYKGKTAYSKKEGYPLSGRFHFRFGLYRDLMKKPMTAYFDEYKKRRLDE
tara:strand:- start:317 stop:1060 length:744 start_codon:yes stop_codon:yes gene_type:complete